MTKEKNEKDYSEKMSENLKKAVTEMLILLFLSKKDMTIHEILNILDKKSQGICKIQYPYGVIYRMSDRGYIEISGKAVSEERRRIHYRITDKGREYLKKINDEYNFFWSGVNMIMTYIDELDENVI